MMARLLVVGERLQLRADVLRRVGEPLAVREVGAEDDRLDPDLGDDALHVLLGEGRDHEVAAEDLARALGRARRHFALRPMRNAWSILRSV